MRSVTAITVAATATALTTLDRFKAELDIAGTDSDELIAAKIDEASSDIEAHCNRTFCRETISETFFGDGCADYLILNRFPVASITSVAIDGVTQDSSLYRLDTEAGLLYCLDANGYVTGWEWCRDVVVVYAAGYVMPGEQGRDLPPALEAGCIELVKSFWLSRRRDATVKAVDIPGVIAEQYWVGSIGEDGELPPAVTEKISPFRRASV